MFCIVLMQTAQNNTGRFVCKNFFHFVRGGVHKSFVANFTQSAQTRNKKFCTRRKGCVKPFRESVQCAFGNFSVPFTWKYFYDITLPQPFIRRSLPSSQKTRCPARGLRSANFARFTCLTRPSAKLPFCQQANLLLRWRLLPTYVRNFKMQLASQNFSAMVRV